MGFLEAFPKLHIAALHIGRVVWKLTPLKSRRRIAPGLQDKASHFGNSAEATIRL